MLYRIDNYYYRNIPCTNLCFSDYKECIDGEKVDYTPANRKKSITEVSPNIINSSPSYVRPRRSNLLTIKEHRKIIKESVTIMNGPNLGPSLCPSGFAEVRIRLVKIKDNNEDAKGLQTLSRTLHEIHRIIKQRILDILLMKKMMEGIIGLPKEQILEETINKIAASENSRVKNEYRKISLLSPFCIDDRKAKK